MKTISLLLFLGLIFFQLDAQTRKEKKAFKEKEIKELIDGGRYKFVARNALPMGGGSIDLTSEYDLVIDSTRIKSFLPFLDVLIMLDMAIPKEVSNLMRQLRNFPVIIMKRKSHI